MKWFQKATGIQALSFLAVLGLTMAPLQVDAADFEDLPKDVRRTIERELKGFRIDDIDRDKDDGKTVYKIDADIKVELTISSDGKVLGRKEERDKYHLPEKVIRAVEYSVGDMDYGDIDKLTDSKGRVSYDIEGELDGNSDVDILVTSDGEVLDRDVENEEEFAKNGPESTLTIIAKLTAKSAMPTLKDIRPYREALVVYEYEVGRRLEGRFDGDRIRVSHWAIYDKTTQKVGNEKIGTEREVRLTRFEDIKELERTYKSDTLDMDFDVPLYHDVGQIIRRDVSEKRFDYECGLSEKMRVFWMLKDQLKLVVLGDSRGEEGVRAELFYGEENAITPVAFNLANSGASLEFQELLIEEYLVNLPKLEWVALQLSPRIVNRDYGSSDYKKMRKSAGYRYDQEHADALWVTSENSVVTVEGLMLDPDVRKDWKDMPWGWDSSDDTWDDPDFDDDDDDEYELSSERWNTLESLVKMLKKRNVKMLLYLSPIHPIIRKADYVDDDDTTRKGYEQLVERLEKLEQTHSNLVFADLLKGGNHDFDPDMFGDLDHLNKDGADKLTRMLEDIRKRSQAPITAASALPYRTGS